MRFWRSRKQRLEVHVFITAHYLSVVNDSEHDVMVELRDPSPEGVESFTIRTEYPGARLARGDVGEWPREQSQERKG